MDRLTGSPGCDIYFCMVTLQALGRLPAGHTFHILPQGIRSFFVLSAPTPPVIIHTHHAIFVNADIHRIHRVLLKCSAEHPLGQLVKSLRTDGIRLIGPLADNQPGLLGYSLIYKSPEYQPGVQLPYGSRFPNGKVSELFRFPQVLSKQLSS